jgi:ABC-type amino acid transport substrate-binding protein
MKNGYIGIMRNLAIAALAMAASAAPAFAEAPSTLQKILSGGTLRVGTTGDYNPMTIFDPKTNSHRGYEIDAATQLAKDLGVKLEFVRTDWKSLIQGLASDKYDILMSLAHRQPGLWPSLRLIKMGHLVKRLQCQMYESLKSRNS